MNIFAIKRGEVKNCGCCTKIINFSRFCRKYAEKNLCISYVQNNDPSLAARLQNANILGKTKEPFVNRECLQTLFLRHAPAETASGYSISANPDSFRNLNSVLYNEVDLHKEIINRNTN
jgi:hypothetical protein